MNTTISVEIDSSSLDAMLEKANQLGELRQIAKALNIPMAELTQYI